MATKRFPKQVNFWMSSDDYDALQKFFLIDGRTMTTFLRSTIRKEIISSEVECKINKIWELGRHKSLEKSVRFLMSDNDFSALNKHLKYAKMPLSVFLRYLTRKELQRLEIEKEKNQTWDLE